MSDNNFTNYGYQITRELGHNRAGGRITYLAQELITGNSVVIKEFKFANRQSNWLYYSIYEREIQVLRDLDLPNIPRYLDSFPTSTGFCIVQEYKNAPSLAQSQPFTPQQVKQIAISVLEILKYLQNRIPPVIHRDLKPENILVDDRLHVYLVDFGFARMGGGEVAVSSVVKGTLGFMPPEQMFNRQLTLASDLYSLGATLICLLTQTPSTQVGTLMDDLGRINHQKHLAHLAPEFSNWLQKIVAPNYQERYQSAEAALEDLIPLSVLKPVKIHHLPLAIASLATLGCIAIGITQSSLLQNLTKPPFLGRFESVFTEEFDRQKPGHPIAKASGKKPIYFYVRGDRLKQEYFEGSCRLLDPSGKLEYIGTAPVFTKNKTLEVWCFHEFKPTPKPGMWTFIFELNSQSVSTQKIEISP